MATTPHTERSFYMETKIQFVNIQSSDGARSFIADHLGAIRRRFSHFRKSVQFDFRILEGARNPSGELCAVRAQALLKVSGRRRVKVEKESGDVWSAAKATLEGVEKILRRESEKSEHGRRLLGRSNRSVREQKRTRVSSREE